MIYVQFTIKVHDLQFTITVHDLQLTVTIRVTFYNLKNSAVSIHFFSKVIKKSISQVYLIPQPPPQKKYAVGTRPKSLAV